MKYYLIIFITLFNCNSKPELKNIELNYYANSNKLIQTKRVKFQIFDSVYYYNKNKSIFKKGKQHKNGQKFGVWKLYGADSKVKEIREWFCINGKSQINRNWFIGNDGDTIAYNRAKHLYSKTQFIGDTLGFRNSCYDKFVFLTNDTIKVNEFYLAFAHCGSPLLRDFDSKIKVIVDNTNSLNNDFSNINSVKLDTFQYAKIDTIHKADFGSYDLNKIAAFSGKFKNPGKKTLRGLMIEYSDKYIDTNGEIAYAESKTYFEKEIYVKDTIK